MGTSTSHHKIPSNGELLHVGITGEGSPVYLLHGWPQTSHEWQHVVAPLAEHHTVVTIDLRGLGASSRPATGYDAHALGDDVAGVAAALGHDRIDLVGHDWGGLAALGCAARHRDLVEHLAVFEMTMPGLGLLESIMVAAEGPGYIWHMGFQSVPDIPHMLMQGREREYLTYFFTTYAYDPTAITAADVDIYVSAMQQVGALRAGLEYYTHQFRTGEQVRALQDDKLELPVMAYGGAACMGELPKQALEMIATDVRGGVVDRAGHWIPEERPDFVVEAVLAFVRETAPVA
jgi:pimeloyl-ACP methyl ester carboxylesterase